MTPHQWKSKGQNYKVLERNIFAVASQTGKKDTILLVHGFPTCSFDFEPIWDRLSASYNLVAPDMLGFGYSDKPYPHTYSIHEQADIVEGFATKTGLQTCHIFAHDYGDTVVQELMARQNDGALGFSIQSVCFLNGGLFPETHNALLIQKLLLSPLGPLINKLTRKSNFDQSFSRVFGPDTKPSADQLEDFWNLINANNGRHMFHSMITYMRDRRENRSRWIDAIGNFTGPVALMNGSCDPVSGAHMVKRYHELLGSPDFLREYSKLGHYPHLEAPETIANDYLEFLSEIIAHETV